MADEVNGMKEGPVIAINSKGPEVKKLQEWLETLQYPVGLVDGVFGPQTKKAVQLFQSQYGLLADGIVGEKTRLALEAALEKKGLLQKERISANWVDLTQFDLEKHVEESFRTALSLAGGQPINAGHALQAALLVSQSVNSTAFSKLTSLLPIEVPREKVMAPIKKLKAFPLDLPLAEAFSVAEPFLKRERVWGRDYITLALLAGNDQSLREVAEIVGVSLKALQDDWFRFVSSDEIHRDRKSWEEWWQKAGVPLPEEITEEKSVDLTQFELQKHVEEAFRIAWALSEGKPINARHSLYAALILSDSIPSGAFPKLADLLPIKELDQPKTEQVSSLDLRAVPLVSPLAKSFSIAEPFLKQKGVWGRDYITIALLAVNDPSLEKIAKEAGSSLKAIQKEWFRYVTLDERHRDRSSWEKWWHDAGVPPPEPIGQETDQEETGKQPTQDTLYIAPRAWVETDSIPTISDHEYRPSKLDSLDMKDRAHIFATLLIAKDIKPPFALGLLGDWGVGKTFFMRLMIERVASIAGKNAAAGQMSDSVSRAAQIEFNAWHYVDSDLWASLASRIYDGLSRELCLRGEKVEQTRRTLRQRITSSQQEKGEASAALEAAKKKRQEAAEELITKQTERDRLKADYDKRLLRRVWEAVLEVKPDPKDPATRDWPDLGALKEKAEDTAKRLGITEGINNVQEAQRVYLLLNDLLQRGSGLALAFNASMGRNPWFSASVLLLILGVVLSWPVILGKFETWLQIAAGSATNLLAPLLQLTTIIGTAAVWAGKNIKSISSAMGYLEQIKDEIQNPRQEPSLSNAELELKKQIEDSDADIAIAQSKIEQADRQIAEAQAEIERIDAGGLVYDFLEGRVRDSRYLDRLGLISVIRQDFEELRSILLDWQTHGLTQDQINTLAPKLSWDARPIDRIILYIDDLDRCPPKRVVEVLQAVHLLLAFDLFVVVVAVDARWLERSLNEAYNPVKATHDGSFTGEPVHRFSAHNYLEKIFQIPFHLPTLEKHGYRKLVLDLIAKPRIRVEHEVDEHSKKDEKPAQTKQVEPKADEPPHDIKPSSVEEPPSTDLDLETEAVATMERKKLDLLAEEERQRQQEKVETDKRIEAMLLQEWEEEFIAALSPFIQTPRLAKRLVNTYRLLRVHIAMIIEEEKEDFSKFIDREVGDYRAVLILLAINVGCADVAPEIFRDLDTAEGDNFLTWITLNSKKYEEKRHDQQENYGPGSGEIRLGELIFGLAKIKSNIESVIELLGSNGPSFEYSLEIYRKWAHEVGRYSFRSHLLADAQLSERHLLSQRSDKLH